MPNWCDNSIRLSNQDKTKIDAIESVLRGNTESGVFNHLRPNPKGEWEYDWSVNNWGTKWDADVIDWERDGDNDLTLYCNTAWSPPIALYEYLYEQGWEIDALYNEPGCAFAGAWCNGDDAYYEYDISSASSIEDLPMDIIDFAGLENAHEDWLEDRKDEYLRGLDRTEWYSNDVKPVHVGRYEITSGGYDWAQYADWNGENWGRQWDGSDIVPDKWRGLNKEFTDADYQTMLDTIAEEN